MNLSPDKTRLPGSEGLVPPIIALLIAVGFRRIIPALLIAVLSGAAIQQTEHPLGIFWDEVSGVFVALFRMVGGEATAPAGYLGPVLDDAFNLQILGFTFVLVGMISIVNRMGGTSGLVSRLTRLVRGPKSAQAVTAMTGTGSCSSMTMPILLSWVHRVDPSPTNFESAEKSSPILLIPPALR